MVPGYEEGVDLTPVISGNQLEKVEGYARSGDSSWCRSSSWWQSDRIEKGTLWKLLVLNNVTQDMTVAREEIFGPVLSVIEVPRNMKKPLASLTIQNMD